MLYYKATAGCGVGFLWGSRCATVNGGLRAAAMVMVIHSALVRSHQSTSADGWCDSALWFPSWDGRSAAARSVVAVMAMVIWLWLLIGLVG